MHDCCNNLAQLGRATPSQSASCALGRGKTKITALTKLGGAFRFILNPALLLAVFSHPVFAATPASTLVENTAFVNYEFRGTNYQVSDKESFITARDTTTGVGTPSVITLMHNSIDFSGQYQAAQAGAGSTGNITATGNSVASTNPTSASSRSFRATARTTASSSGTALAGNFPVTQGQCATDESATNLVSQAPPKDYQGKTLGLPSTLNLNSDEYFKVGDTIFVHLQDLDQNQDPTIAEKIIVTILSNNGLDKETIQLTETSVSSGLFTGYVQSASLVNHPANHFDCVLSVSNNSSMQASYEDQYDSRDLVKAGALFDPSSYVVNGDTGEYVNGIDVVLLDPNKPWEETQPEDEKPYGRAAVLSDAGGIYPSRITTGSQVTDSKGNVLQLPYGGFAFPVLATGQYIIQVGESVYYEFPYPEQKSLTDIPTSTNGPFNFDEQGSRGRAFTNSGITFRMDVPLDPKDNSVLLTKTSNKNQAGVGDLVSYNIKLQNTEIPGVNVELHDQLPQGFRFVPGSASIDGVQLPDPTISDNGAHLVFTFATIAAQESFNLRYTTRIGVNTAMGQATNTAWLVDDDLDGLGKLEANITTAVLEVKEELFSEATRLFGRVYIGDCEGDVEQEGISGVRIYLENGTYVVTDEDGMWHIEAQQPGTHVVQLDTDTLPKFLDLMACDNYGTHAGREYSQFVDLAPGSFWRTDFVVKLKPPSQGEVTQRLTSQVSPLTETELAKVTGPIKQKLAYRLLLTGSEVVLKDLRSLIMLPEGVSYKAGSVLLDGNPIPEPKKYDEQTLLFSLNDPGKDWQHILEFEGWINQDAKAGELTTRSVAMFNAPSQKNQRTPVALTSALLAIIPENKQAHKPEQAPKFSSFSEELNDADKQELQKVIANLRGLKNLKLEVAGHTDDMPIAKRSRHIFSNNQELSLARARSAANYIMQELALEANQVSISGYGADKPIARNISERNRAKNRRVEVNILGGENGLSLAQADSGNQMVATLGIAPGGFDFPIEATASGPINTVTMPEFDKAYLAQTDNRFEWLWPSGGYLPNIPSTKIALKHPMDSRIRLTLNGNPVSELNFVKRETYAANQSAISLWGGVDIKEGNNHFIATLVDKNEDVVDRKEFDLHYAGTPTRVEYLPNESKASADGVVAPVIAVKLYDRDGYPVRNGLQGEFNIDSPYLAFDPDKNQAQINRSDFKPHFEISHDGIAYITLEPTTQAGEAVIRFPLANGQQEEVRVWLTPQNREWMFIALGEGTIGYQAFSGNKANAIDQDVPNDFYADGRLALFAKGQVLGDWLITAAFDSDKGKTTPFEKLLEPNKYYTLYGDNSQQKLDASMEGKLYVRVERERFYAVFGDFSTDLNNTDLSKYLRKFHGIQSVFQGDIVSFNAFVTESAQRFGRDEIQGDGTSGLYRLTEKNIISNSETISIQVRDRLRSEVILSEVELTKDSDYSIDYFDGTIFFKSPVQSTDENFNPRFIIARYETRDNNASDMTYGGRAAVHVLDKQLEFGATVISEELGEQSKTLTGVDLTLKVSDELEIKAEAANTEKINAGVSTQATATYVGLDFRGEQLQTKAYVRTEEAGFGLNQLNNSEGNTEKVGIETTYYLTSQRYINGLLSDQNTLNSATRQSLAELKYNQEYESGRYHLGLRANENQSALGDTVSTQQLLAGHSFTLFNGKVLLNADAEFNLTPQPDVYDIVRLGADYRINDQVTLFSIFETGLESDAPQRGVLGLRATPWQGMQLTNSVEQQQSKDGTRLFAVHGLNQEINLDEHWQISFGFDQSRDLQNSILDQNNVTASQDDFYAVSTGWGYRSPTWQWTNRVEYRDSENSEKWNALTGLYRPIAFGLSMGINGEYRLDTQTDNRTEFKQGEFNIGLRPLQFGLAWLNQSKYIDEQQTSGNSDLVSRRILNNTHLNMRWSDTQVSGQYGLKYVDETIDGKKYSGAIDLMGLQVRHHIDASWDWGVHAQRLYDYQLKDSRHSLGFSIGFIPKANTWVSMGYNFTGFTDNDFDNAGYSAHGVYLKLRIKADQDSIAELKNYFNQ